MFNQRQQLKRQALFEERAHTMRHQPSEAQTPGIAMPTDDVMVKTVGVLTATEDGTLVEKGSAVRSSRARRSTAPTFNWVSGLRVVRS